MENDSKPRMYSHVGEKLVSETSVDSNCEKKAEAASGNQTKIFTVSHDQSQNSCKRKNSESSADPGNYNMICFPCYCLLVHLHMVLPKGTFFSQNLLSLHYIV